MEAHADSTLTGDWFFTIPERLRQAHHDHNMAGSTDRMIRLLYQQSLVSAIMIQDDRR
jgi:hypothetical protein